MIDSTNPRILANNIKKLLARINAIVPGTVVTGNPSGSGFNTLLTKIKIGDSKYKLPDAVVGNPEGEATDSLSKLSIGSSIFSISDSYTPPAYSTTETEVGTWIDGKKLYRVVFEKDSGITSGSDVSIAHGISNIDKVCLFTGYSLIGNGAYCNYSDSGYLVDCHEVNRTNTQWNLGASIVSQISKLVVIIYYTKTS